MRAGKDTSRQGEVWQKMILIFLIEKIKIKINFLQDHKWWFLRSRSVLQVQWWWSRSPKRSRSIKRSWSFPPRSIDLEQPCHGVLKRFLGRPWNLGQNLGTGHWYMMFPDSKNVTCIHFLLRPTLLYRNLATLSFLY